MTVYLLRRLLLLAPVLLGVTLLTFAIAQLAPGDPVQLMLGEHATPERIEALRSQLGYDDPLWTQYGRFLWNALHGDLGLSVRGQSPVLDDILALAPSTFALTVAALFVAVIVGVPAGLLAATSRNHWLDGSLRLLSVVGLSIPGFWLGVLLILIFAVNLRWFAVSGDEGLKALILPALALGLVEAAVLARLARTSALETMSQDYVLTARAKGLPRRRVNWHHVLRNALIPVVTVLGLQAGALLGGAVFIEAVFARPGIGRFAVNAVNNRDLPQIQGVVLFVAVTYVLANLGVDILYGLIDPRIGEDALR